MNKKHITRIAFVGLLISAMISCRQTGHTDSGEGRGSGTSETESSEAAGSGTMSTPTGTTQAEKEGTASSGQGNNTPAPGVEDTRLHNSREGNPDTDTSAARRNNVKHVKEITPPEVTRPKKN